MSLQVEIPPNYETGRRSNRTRLSKVHARRRHITPSTTQQSKMSNGMYVHSSPPKVVPTNPSVIRQWLRNGDIDKLEQVVLEGHGQKLVGEYSPDSKVRNFLKSLPEYIANIETLHNLVVKGDIENMKQIINKDKSSKLALCKDQSGVGLLHKAVYYDHQDIVNWLATKYPSTLSMKDKEGRTALHYCAACKDQHAVWEVLENAGADTTTVDNQGHNAEYYLQHPEQAELPEAPKSSGTMRRFTSGKDGFVVTRANIRIWIHDRDIGRLQQMLWEGHGDKLRVETSNNPRVKRFLDAVPYIMGVIKDVHGSVIRNDLPMLQKRTADPVPPTIFMSKDKNGLNPLHKAAGLGHADIVEYILEKNPKAATMTDNDGKLPLHYAAAVKDNGKIFNMLVDAGCDEKLQDNKGKFPAYYKMKPNEADPNSYLQVVPEAPRTASVFPPGWDWRLLNNMTYDFGPIGGVVQKHLFGKPDDLISEKSKTEDSAIDIQSEPEQNQENAYEEDNKDVNNENEENYPELVNKHMEGGLGDEDEGVGDDGEYPDRSDTQEDYHNDNEDSGNVDRWEREDTGEEKEAVDESESYDDENNTVNNEGYDDETGEQNRPETSIAGNEEGEEEGEENYSGLEKEGEAFDMRDDENNEQDEDGKINSEQNTEETDNMKDMTKAEVKNLVDTGNMEGLASLILNGQGEKLIGHTSDDPELQSFLSNVPAYMAKIQAVHAAAREGRLRDLQAALDRRKFAIARENASGVGATPLHVATLFGHTSIVRYLGGRFPETLHARDNKGRTPLHYAATIRDNGHYYNMLTTMGADHKLEDNDGRTAQYYRDNPNELTHQQLLEEYGASSSIASDTLEDKVPNDEVSARRDIDDPEMIETLEQCFEVLRENIVTNGYPENEMLLKRYLKRPMFDKLKFRLTCMDHNLLDVIWPGVKKLPDDGSTDNEPDEDLKDIINENGGVIAPDYESYFVFSDLLTPLIKDLHGLIVTYDLNLQPNTMFYEPANPNSDEENDNISDTKSISKRSLKVDEVARVKIDPSSRWVISGQIECSRNFTDFLFPSSLSLAQLEDIEREVLNVLDESASETPDANKEDDEIVHSDDSGTYFKLEEILAPGSGICGKLKELDLIVPLSDLNENYNTLLHGQHWPHGRGVYLYDNNKAAVWINVQEHIRILTHIDATGSVGKAYENLVDLLDKFNEKFEFRKDPYLGFLTSRPSCLGNTLHFYLTIYLPKLGEEEDKLRRLCSVRGLNMRKANERDNAYRVWNKQSLSINELQTFRDFCSAATNIIQLEKSLSASSNNQNVGGLLKRFKKK